MWAALCGDASRRDYRRFIFAASRLRATMRTEREDGKLCLTSPMLTEFWQRSRASQRRILSEVGQIELAIEQRILVESCLDFSAIHQTSSLKFLSLAPPSLFLSEWIGSAYVLLRNAWLFGAEPHLRQRFMDLVLAEQLAFYEERQVQPRRLNDSVRSSLIAWSRLCNWK